MFCINIGCVSSATGDDDLCNECREQLAKEAINKANRESREAAILSECENSGKFMSTNTPIYMSGKQNGLSQFRDETAREERREERKAKREKREAERDKRRKERLAAQPVGMGGQKDEGGNGTSRKSRQKAKKRSPGSRFFRNDNHGMAVRHKK